MGCTTARPRPPPGASEAPAGLPAQSTTPKRASQTRTMTPSSHLANAALSLTPGPPVSDVYSLVVGVSSPSKVDPHRPTTTGVALEYIRQLAATKSADTLVSEFFGDHDEFCAKLSQNPSTTHFLNKKADYFVIYPSNCTISGLLQAISDVPNSPVFLWIDGQSTATNGANRSALYLEALLELYKQIGKGILVASPWSEPSPLPAIRALEMYYAKISGCAILVAASKKECDDFVREMREKPLGPTRFRQVLDHEIEDTSSSTPVSEIIRENFVSIRTATASLYQRLVVRLADDMLSRCPEDEEARAIALASRASLHYALGELDDAKRKFEDALALLMKVRNSPFAASVLHNIAKIYEDQGNVNEALELYERCIAMEEPVSRLSVRMSSQEVLKSQRTPSSQNLKQQLEGGRGGFWRDSFTIPSPHDIGSATTLFNVACIMTERFEWDKAERLFQESLASRQACATNGESLDVAWCLNALGVFYERFGRHEQALESFQNALAMRRKCNASEELLGESLENLGGYLLSRGRREDSKPLLEEALALRVKHFGLDSNPVAHSLFALAMWWRDEDSVKATRLATEALEIYHKSKDDTAAAEVFAEFGISVSSLGHPLQPSS